jgi:hypothetical protein
MNIESLIETVRVIDFVSLCEALGINAEAVKQGLDEPTFGDADDTLINAKRLIGCIGENCGLDENENTRLTEALENVPEGVLIGLGS